MNIAAELSACRFASQALPSWHEALFYFGASKRIQFCSPLSNSFVHGRKCWNKVIKYEC